jgi:hypothetical protein
MINEGHVTWDVALIGKLPANLAKMPLACKGGHMGRRVPDKRAGLTVEMCLGGCSNPHDWTWQKFVNGVNGSESPLNSHLPQTASPRALFPLCRKYFLPTIRIY